MYENQDVINLFIETGTSNGMFGLDKVEEDDFYVKCLKKANNFYLEKIEIKDLMEYDENFKEYIKENKLREYIDLDGELHTHENKYIYEYIDSLKDGLNIPPIIAFDKDKPYVLDGFNRLLQHYKNENFEVEVFIDTKAYELFFDKKEFDLSI